jgi:hypothetical protein
MKTELHLKIISIIIAFSLLFLSLHNQQPIFAETIRVLMNLLIIIYFIIIWMRTKKILPFIGSMLLPIWLLILSHPGSITDYLFVIEKESNLQKITHLIQSNPTYEKLSTYSLLHFDNASQSAHETDTQNQVLTGSSTLHKSKTISSSRLQQLLKQNYITAFQLSHGSILFHINNHRQVRYYFEENNFTYQGDVEIKPQWYSVN